MAVGAFVEALATDPLITIDWQGRPAPRLAERWSFRDRGQRLEFTLRPDVRFHDASPLTSDEVVRALRALLAGGRLGSNAIQSIDSDGPDKVAVALSRPDAFIFEDLAIGLSRFGHPGIGTGPFRIVHKKSPIELQAFSGYYRGRPAIDRIRIHTYDTQRSAWAAMMRGEVDSLHEVSREAADFVEAQSGVRTYPYPSPYYIPLVFNVRRPVLQNVEVRRALSEAVDRQAIVTDALHGRGIAAEGPLWPQFWAFSPGQHSYSYNPQSARNRLEAAGYPLHPAANGQMPKRFSFTCLYWNDGPQYERIALVLQKQLFDVGVDVQMQPLPLNELYGRITSGNFDAFLLQMTSGHTLSFAYRFWHSAPPGKAVIQSGYNSTDAILDRLRASTSDEETRAGVADLQRVLYDDPPAIFLVWPTLERAVSNRFDVPVEPNRDIISVVWQWRLHEPVEQASR